MSAFAATILLAAGGVVAPASVSDSDASGPARGVTMQASTTVTIVRAERISLKGAFEARGAGNDSPARHTTRLETADGRRLVEFH